MLLGVLANLTKETVVVNSNGEVIKVLHNEIESEKKCFIAAVQSEDEIENAITTNGLNNDVIEKFNKYFYGFSFCTNKTQFSNMFVESDYSFEFRSEKRERGHYFDMFASTLLNQTDKMLFSRASESFKGKTKSIPMYMFRMMNMPNYIFNNYVLDNYLFDLVGINSLIKSFYTYKYYYSGKNINITALSLKQECKDKSFEGLLSGDNAFAKDTNVNLLEEISCDNTIKLSNVIKALESIDDTNILVIPISGPKSDIFERVLQKLKLKTIVISSIGFDCDQSPTNGIIVGSSSKHGTISNFSSNCADFYAIGEDIESRSGAAYSTAVTANIAALYMEKYQDYNEESIKKYLRNNSIRNFDEYFVLRTPLISSKKDRKTFKYYNSNLSLALIFIFLIIIIFLIGKFLGFFRRKNRNDLYIEDSIDDQFN